MSSKQEIKDAFTAELRNTSQYQIILKIKQAILDEISRPNIQQYIMYTYEQPLNDDEELEVFKMCFLLEFGFIESNCSRECIGVQMAKFLT